MRSRSGSTTSITSTKELSADNIPINVSICDDKTIKLNIRPIHAVSNILEFLSASTTLPADVRLVMDGKPLDPASTVAQLKLQESSILKLDPPTRRSASPTHEAPVGSTAAPAPDSRTSATPTPASTPRTSTPSKRPSRPRCSKADCKALAPPIVGDCGFCQKRFCGKHRMLESHNCEGLQDARQADKDRNAAKLQSERTVMLRGL
ncbi:hypothetical protein DV737_g4911, partial [Chaetothyriales sp. CBS 132003]